MNPDIHPKYFCHDSAADCTAIYEYFHRPNITTLIDHNARNKATRQYDEKEHMTADGIPVYTAGHTMIYDGYDPNRHRKKYRCPLACGKIASCPFQDECSTSSYGRTVYVNDSDQARNTDQLSYRSDRWKQIYKNRTSTARTNNRVLNNYKLQHMRIRNKAKFAFFDIMAVTNIHLDDWIKTG